MWLLDSGQSLQGSGAETCRRGPPGMTPGERTRPNPLADARGSVRGVWPFRGIWGLLTGVVQY